MREGVGAFLQQERRLTHHRLAVHTHHGPGSIRDGTAEAVRVWLLGGFEVSVGSRVVGGSSWRLRKAQTLVKLLALAPRHRLHREQIMDVLWPDLDAKSQANNLHRTLHLARKVLEGSQANGASPCLRLRGDLVALCPDGPLWVDVEAFEGAAATARRSREPAAYRAALDLYTGELLPEDRYEAWAEERREGLRRVHHTLLVELAALHEEREEYAPAVEALERAAAEEPAHEAARMGLMRLYAANGRRNEAILHYGQLRKTLSEELDLHPTDASRRLYEEIRAGKSPTAPLPHPTRPSEEPASTAPNNLPAPLTSFVGRETEVLNVKRTLSMTRLLTLTGAGGSGKTRLALEVARDLVGSYPDGVWLAELAPLADPTLLPRVVAAALGVREHPDLPLTQTLCNHLGSRRTLLVLDNCEHLIDAAARLVKDLLCACPNLRVLASSREPLVISGETVWPVPTLSLPDPEAEISVEALMGAEAVQLFVDRARSRLPDFELTPENARSVATICRDLDGLPLAIELSTARMGALAVEQVAERLEDSLKLLTGGDRTVAPRHQTLRATLEWSYELLSEPERSLFGRLSVFAGGWTLEAAEAVGAGEGIEEGEVLDLLSRLVSKSMVVVESAEGSALRYGMLQPVRQYGQERLGATGEADLVRRRHAWWYFELAKEVEPWLRGARQEVWLEHLEREYSNLRAALGWALERGETELALWFGGALAEFWYLSGHLSEGRRWLEAALASSTDSPPSPARAKALARAGWIAWEQGDYGRSVVHSQESLALSRELEDETGAVAALSNLGWAALLGNDLGRAAALAEEALTLGRTLGDTGGVARALLILGLAAVARGDHDRALALHEESLELAREAEDGLAMALSVGMGALASLGRGDERRARALCEEGLALCLQPRVMNVTAFHLHASAALASWQGRAARSARLWGAAGSVREAIGATLSPVELGVYGHYIDAARMRLEEAAWEEAWEEGKAMRVEEAVEYALAESEERRRGRTPRRSPTPNEPPTSGRPEDVLTRRELEVAALAGGGLTNRQIAEELSISEHTAATHLRRILKKLGFRSRAQLCA